MVLGQLASQLGQRTAAANIAVAAQCNVEPALLDEIAAGLTSRDERLAGDCAEVMTEVARARPELVAPHAAVLVAVLDHKATRVRWEAMHAMSFVAAVAPEIITPLLPQLHRMIHDDSSVIVRDYAVDAVGNYAGTSRDAALRVYPLLQEALVTWGGNQVTHALTGLGNVCRSVHKLNVEISAYGRQYEDEKQRPSIRKAAKDLLRVTGRH